jgi:ABC-2 type transport system permease protein
MAGVGALGDAGQAGFGAGPFSRLARSQYIALVGMRWQVLTHGLRSTEGLFELGARGVAFLVYALMGLGLGTGLGVIAHSLASERNWQLLPILFWVVCFLWQLVPVALASFQQQFDMSGLLRFPVSFSAFCLLYVIFGLADISTLLGGLCCLGILVGVSLARPDLFVWMVLGLTGFAAFNILLVRVILVWIDHWLARRRTREIVSALFVLFLLSLQLLNPALHESRSTGGKASEAKAAERRTMAQEMEPVLRVVSAVQQWLPPGLAVVELKAAAGQEPARALGAMGGLGLYVLAAGALLAVRLRAEYRGESLSEAPSRQEAQKDSAGSLLDGAGPIAAVMEKELHTLLRSMPLLYMIGAPVFMVIVLGGLFRSNAAAPGHTYFLALPLCVAYALLGPAQMIYNNLGAEGTGIQIVFLSPTPIQTVLLAKNLFHALIYGLTALLAGILASLMLGRPNGVVLATTIAWLLFALPANLAVGNAFSLAMPHRLNLGRLTRQRGSAASALLTMFMQTTLLGVAAAVFALCLYFGRLWMAVPVFLVLAGAAVFAWMRVLRNADGVANRRRDLLISTLAKTE